MKKKYICLLIIMIIMCITINVKAADAYCSPQSAVPSVVCSGKSEKDCKANSACYWVEPKECSISVSATGCAGFGETVSVSYKLSNCSGKSVKISCSGGTCPSSSSSGSFKATTGNSCGNMKITVSKEGKSGSATVKIRGNWTAYSNGLFKSRPATSRTKANSSCQDVWGNCKKNSDKTYTCSGEHRSCSGAPSSSSLTGSSTTSTATSTSSYDFCIPSSIAVSPQEVSAKTCEDKDGVTVTYKDGKACSGESYYSISCDNTLNVKFDNDDDSSKGNATSYGKTLLAGQGFEYSAELSLSRTCTGKFEGKKWSDTYKAINTELSDVNKQLKNKKLR